MATHELTRNLSGLARALAQQGLMSEHEADTLQTQAHVAGVSFVEQVLAGKRMTALQLAVFASRAFGVPLLDLAAFDIDEINKDYVDTRTAAASAPKRPLSRAFSPSLVGISASTLLANSSKIPNDGITT
jgi:type IV pilus assembly protein PilB